MVPSLSHKVAIFTNLGQNLSKKFGFFLNFGKFHELAF